MGGGGSPPPQIIYPPPAPAPAPTTQVPTQALASQAALNEVSGKQQRLNMELGAQLDRTNADFFTGQDIRRGQAAAAEDRHLRVLCKGWSRCLQAASQASGGDELSWMASWRLLFCIGSWRSRRPGSHGEGPGWAG